MDNFEEIYRKYFRDVYLYIFRLSKNEDISEEITSDTFFKAMKAIDSFRGDCDLRVWLCQIAKNCYYNYLKKQKKIRNTEDFDLLNLTDNGHSVEDRLSDGSDADEIRKILHEIPQPYREVFMWRVFAELTFKQIGQIFGKSDNWACVTFYRSRKMIQKELEGKL